MAVGCGGKDTSFRAKTQASGQRHNTQATQLAVDSLRAAASRGRKHQVKPRQSFAPLPAVLEQRGWLGLGFGVAPQACLWQPGRQPGCCMHGTASMQIEQPWLTPSADNHAQSAAAGAPRSGKGQRGSSAGKQRSPLQKRKDIGSL